MICSEIPTDAAGQPGGFLAVAIVVGRDGLVLRPAKPERPPGNGPGHRCRDIPVRPTDNRRASGVVVEPVTNQRDVAGPAVREGPLRRTPSQPISHVPDVAPDNGNADTRTARPTAGQ
jgi:hypothetical protein